jgi:hypothetical protein
MYMYMSVTPRTLRPCSRRYTYTFSVYVHVYICIMVYILCICICQWPRGPCSQRYMYTWVYLYVKGGHLSNFFFGVIHAPRGDVSLLACTAAKHTILYVYVYMCMCVCVCVCVDALLLACTAARHTHPMYVYICVYIYINDFSEFLADASYTHTHRHHATAKPRLPISARPASSRRGIRSQKYSISGIMS